MNIKNINNPKRKTERTRRRILICPNCKKENLNFMPWLGLIYECRECGWRGPLAISRLVSEKQKGRKKDEKKTNCKISTSRLF